MGFIGESGAGKSTVARALLGLVPPSSGAVEIRGVDVARCPAADAVRLRGEVQAVMQNPFASLDPRWRVERIVAEPIVAASRYGGRRPGREQIAERVRVLLDGVGLDPSKARARPRELSGGERQRVAVARALSVGPSALIADEPVTALDNATKRQIVELLRQVGARHQMGMLVISHSMSFVAELAARIYVIADGQIVEEGSVERVLTAPRHPFTARLVEASRVLDAWGDEPRSDESAQRSS